MIYTPAYFKRNLPKKKWNEQPLACKFLYRPISYVLSSFFTLIHFSANMVSILSVFFAFIASGLLFFGNQTLNIISACFFILWICLDCTDGNIARCVKKQKYGDFLDAVSGYIITTFYILSLGYSVFINGGIFIESENIFIMLLCAFGSTCYVLLLLFKKKYFENSQLYENTDRLQKKSKQYKIAAFIIAEFSSGGIMPIVVLFGFIFGFVDLIVLFYSTLYIILFIFGFLYLLIKVKRENKNLSSNL